MDQEVENYVKALAPRIQLAAMLPKRGTPEFGGAEVERAAGLGMQARGGGAVPSYTDKMGYRSEIRPRVGNEVLRAPGETDVQAKWNSPARKGEIFIVNPEGQRVPRGYWMDYHEPAHGISKAAYDKLSVFERAALEARLQGTGYAPLEAQFKALWGK